MKYYIFFALAVILEIISTSFLKKTDQFTKITPTIISVSAIMMSFYLLSIVQKVIPIGIAYAIWSGFGIVVISLVGYFVYKQRLDLPAIIGIALILLGVVIINIFSKSSVE